MTDLLNIAKECGAELVEPFRGVISKREMLTMTTDQLHATVEKVCLKMIDALEQ